MDSNYFNDLLSGTLNNLGVGSGTDAAKTIGSVVASTKNSGTTVTNAAASSTPTIPSLSPHTILGMDQKKVLLIAAALVVGFIVLKRIKK